MTIGGFLSAIDPYAGLIIIKHSEERSTEIVKAARHNKRFYEALEKFIYGGDAISCIIGHGFMLFAILIHAKRIKSSPQIDLLLHLSGYSEASLMGSMPHVNATDIPRNNGAGMVEPF